MRGDGWPVECRVSFQGGVKVVRYVIKCSSSEQHLKLHPVTLKEVFCHDMFCII